MNPPAGVSTPHAGPDLAVNGRDDRPRVEKTSGKRFRVLEYTVLIVLAVAAAFLIKAFVFQVFVVPSGSMEPTIKPGERLLVEKVSALASTPSRGEVWVFDGAGLFTDPGPGEHVFVKRIIGVGGDHVVCCNAQGQLEINGVPLVEDYLPAGTVASKERFNVEVPADSVWVMGDDRDHSADSRAYIGMPGGGFIPTDRMIGRAVAVAWPVSSLRTVSTPVAFDALVNSTSATTH